MAIAEFEDGEWYEYRGKQSLVEWNDEGKMDFVLDGQPHKCKNGRGSQAAFYDGDTGYGVGGRWDWTAGLQNWYKTNKRPKVKK
jgi:hypothetical protein